MTCFGTFSRRFAVLLSLVAIHFVACTGTDDRGDTRTEDTSVAEDVGDDGSDVSDGSDDGGDTSSPPHLEDLLPLFSARCLSCHGGVGTDPPSCTAPAIDGFCVQVNPYTWRPTIDDLHAELVDEPAVETDGILVVPGEPDDSVLVRRIELPATDPLAMPERGDRLTDEQIARIRAWIEAGAPK